MSNKMWDALIEHVKTCVVGGKLYFYYPDDTTNVGVAFNHIYELIGLISGEQCQSADSLSDSQKVCNSCSSLKIIMLGNSFCLVYDTTTKQNGRQCLLF